MAILSVLDIAGIIEPAPVSVAKVKRTGRTEAADVLAVLCIFYTECQGYAAAHGVARNIKRRFCINFAIELIGAIDLRNQTGTFTGVHCKTAEAIIGVVIAETTLLVDFRNDDDHLVHIALFRPVFKERDQIGFGNAV